MTAPEIAKTGMLQGKKGLGDNKGLNLTCTPRERKLKSSCGTAGRPMAARINLVPPTPTRLLRVGPRVNGGLWRERRLTELISLMESRPDSDVLELVGASSSCSL
eukprot:1485158-Rhodomonas_salina.3